jgi:hypothetical protein
MLDAMSEENNNIYSKGHLLVCLLGWWVRNGLFLPIIQRIPWRILMVGFLIRTRIKIIKTKLGLNIEMMLSVMMKNGVKLKYSIIKNQMDIS